MKSTQPDWANRLRKAIAELRNKIEDASPEDQDWDFQRLRFAFEALAGSLLREALIAGDMASEPTLLEIAQNSPTDWSGIREDERENKANSWLFRSLEQNGLPSEPPNSFTIKAGKRHKLLGVCSYYARQAERLVDLLAPLPQPRANPVRDLRKSIFELQQSAQALYGICRKFELLALRIGPPTSEDWSVSNSSEPLTDAESRNWPTITKRIGLDLSNWWETCSEIYELLDNWPAELTDDLQRPRLERWSVRLRKLINELSMTLVETREAGGIRPESIDPAKVSAHWLKRFDELRPYQEDLLSLDESAPQLEEVAKAVLPITTDVATEEVLALNAQRLQRWFDHVATARFDLYRDLFPWFLAELLKIAGLPPNAVLGAEGSHHDNQAFIETVDEFQKGTRGRDQRLIALRKRAHQAWVELTGLPVLSTESNWQVAAAAAGISPADWEKTDFRKACECIRAWALAKRAQHRPPWAGNGDDAESERRTPPSRIEPKAEAAPKDSRPGPQIKTPCDRALTTYRLWVAKHGTVSQRELAAELTSHGVLTTQGQVSKDIKAVKKFLHAGNVLPVLEPPKRRPITIDPSRIDVGRRADGRTERQRARRDLDSSD